jgi:hypothetical protein
MASLNLFENGCIAVMLWTWPDLSQGLVEVSSLATQVKGVAGVLIEVLTGTATLAPSSPGRRMSALPPKADIAKHYWDVRFVPKADMSAEKLTPRVVLDCYLGLGDSG